jgi:hypothetical protein
MDLKEVVKLQIVEIDKLRAENQRLVAWIMGEGPDALTALQKVYSDPSTPVPEIIKSATSALPFERSKPAAVSVVIDFKARVRNARLKAQAADQARWALEDKAKVIESKPIGWDAPTPGTILGQDDGPDAA